MWRPIETAPKDGSLIDLWCGDYERVADAKWDTKRRAWVEWGIDGFDCMEWVRLPDYYKPTHWMPLPEPPTD